MVQLCEPSITAILPCTHACCATCLIRFHHECLAPKIASIQSENEEEEEEEEERPDFSCVLCRKVISQLIVQELAEELVEKKLVPSLKQLAKHLPFGKHEFKELVVQLLLTQKYEFVLPILQALKRVIVITGHGSHSQTGHSVLKEAMVMHFESLNLRSKELAKNKGVLCVYGLSS